MRFPEGIERELEAQLGVRLLHVQPLGGGMICEAARAETSAGPIFVKWAEDAPQDLFTSEAAGIEALRKWECVRVPEVLCSSDQFLALEFFGNAAASPTAFGGELGKQLARLHMTSRAPAYGGDPDNYIGRLPQANPSCASWPAFYRDHRLAPQIALAKRGRKLGARLERQLSRLLEEVPRLLGDYEAVPCQLHGDLWSGNLLSTSKGPVLIDPSAYTGDREAEIAFTELFGGFPARFLDSYRSEYPLDPGYARRRPLHQLYPLLVHLNHFGEAYLPAVEQVCVNYVKHG